MKNEKLKWTRKREQAQDENKKGDGAAEEEYALCIPYVECTRVYFMGFAGDP
jgi:hypothetical protein